MREDNWYVLYTTSDKQNKVCELLRCEMVSPFVPMIEYYRRDIQGLDKKPMYPGYVFVRSGMNQKDFDEFLKAKAMLVSTYIKQLREEGVTALRKEEIEFFKLLLDEEGILRMSYGYLDIVGGKKKARVTEGPLQYFSDQIVKVDNHDKWARLSIGVLGRDVSYGLILDGTKRKATEWTKKPVIDGEEIDIGALVTKMTEIGG